MVPELQQSAAEMKDENLQLNEDKYLGHIPSVMLNASKGVYMSERAYLFPTSAHILMHLHHTTFVNTVAKGQIAHYEEFLILPQCFELGPIIVLLLTYSIV